MTVRRSLITDRLPIKLGAHRGGCGERVENTLAAFRHAKRSGMDLLELDVYLSADRRVVVSHDSTVERLTGVAGRIGDFRFDALPKVRLPYVLPKPFNAGDQELDMTDRPRSRHTRSGGDDDHDDSGDDSKSSLDDRELTVEQVATVAAGAASGTGAVVVNEAGDHLSDAEVDEEEDDQQSLIKGDDKKKDNRRRHDSLRRHAAAHGARQQHWIDPDEIRFCTLEEVFEEFPEMGINIDLKDPDDGVVHETHQLIKKYHREELTIWGSFGDARCQQMYALDPNVPILFSAKQIALLFVKHMFGILPFVSIKESYLELPLLTPALESTVRRAMARHSPWKLWLFLKIYSFVVNRRSLFRHLQERGIKIIFWVINDAEGFHQAFSAPLHADGVMTDFPTILSQYARSVNN